MKIGIFGGSFDPVHIGHEMIVGEMIHALHLDKCIIFPAKQSPHKGNSIVNDKARLDMVYLQFKDFDCVDVNDYEMNQNKKSYTVDTLEMLKQKYPNDELFFLIGTDQYEKFSKWKRYEDILKLATICVATRDKTVKVHPPFLKINSPLIEVSSTEIRHRIYHNDLYQHFLSNEVYNYIKRWGLYE